MHHLIQNLPVLGTLGMAAMLTGPSARVPIDLGAWAIEALVLSNVPPRTPQIPQRSAQLTTDY